MLKWERDLNALLSIILCGVLLAGYGVQFLWREEPCPLCMLQRLGMLSVASSAQLNIWFGIRTSHYSLGLISAIVGGSVALRHIALHVCPDGSSFGMPILGLSLYTWSFIVFICSILAIALLLFLYNPRENRIVAPLNWWSKLSTALLLLLAFANTITTYMQCGLGTCDD